MKLRNTVMKYSRKAKVMAGAVALNLTMVAVASAQSLSAYTGGAGTCSTTGGTATDPFTGLLCLLEDWTTSSLAVALAVIALVIGVVVGLSRSTFAPALVGLGVAVVFMVGPNVISYVVTGAQLVPHLVGA
ncbi:hypothetical protein BJI67_16215 (plasmid) [Acidihalobacter aeolianus]|uniref:Conjugal transfer protein TrbC n=1 Tax=Acidihalobacter aeolianus TaxID=2792603 RepID=A0A1D8KCU9_9GAMM|nr:hypothetical protein [Acidihalobacter aeolianus]AOV18783.1 hypothetical protein BJI67_16215 [Acidihalobacter aeolianus]